MNLSQLLANRLKEVLTEGQWVIGTNFKAQIEDLDWKEASSKNAWVKYHCRFNLPYQLLYSGCSECA